MVKRSRIRRKRGVAIKRLPERRKARLPFYKELRKETYLYWYEIEEAASLLGITRIELERRVSEQNRRDA